MPFLSEPLTTKACAYSHKGSAAMFQNLKFSHKILLAASAIVISTFALFSLYNDSLQR